MSDAVQQRFFNLVDGVMQSRDNPNSVTYPPKCVALSWWEPFSHHNALGLWKLWLVEGSKSVEALMLTLT